MRANGRKLSLSKQEAGQLQGQIIVLEIVAMTSLALLLGSDTDSREGRNILRLIMQAVRARCDEAGISTDTAACATVYADQLIAAASTSLPPASH